MVSQITGISFVCSTVCSGADQRKYQSSASLAFVRGIHWWMVNPPHKGPVMRIMFPFDDAIMAKCHFSGMTCNLIHCGVVMATWILVYFEINFQESKTALVPHYHIFLNRYIILLLFLVLLWLCQHLLTHWGSDKMATISQTFSLLNTLRPRQNGRDFTDEMHFLEWKCFSVY